MGAPRATEAAIKRALAAWREAGLAVGRMEVTPDGAIILTTPADKAEKPEQSAGPKQWRKIG